MSLGSWFRDYVYIPLGGNRVKKSRWLLNILAVWMLTGFWHGAGWNFLAWGFYYGVLLLFEKLVFGKILKKLPDFVCHIYTLVLVATGWVFFASESFAKAFDYLKVMFVPHGGNVTLFAGWVVTFIVGIIASTPLPKALWMRFNEKRKLSFAETVLCMAALILCIASLVTDSYNPFLYFRF